MDLTTQQVKNKQKNIFAAIFCFSLGFIILVGFGTALDINALIDYKVEWLMLGFGVLIGIIIVAWSRVTHRLDIFEFPMWFSINCYVQVIFAFWFFYHKKALIFPGIRFNFDHWITLAIYLYCFALVALWVGYIIAHRLLTKFDNSQIKSKPRLRRKFSIIIWCVLWLITTISVQANLLGWGGVDIDVWSNYINFIKVLYDITTIALMLVHFRNPTKFGWFWLSIVIVSTLFNGVAVGTRAAALFFIMIFIVAYYATNKYKLGWIAIGVVALLFLAPAATNLRDILPRYQIS